MADGDPTRDRDEPFAAPGYEPPRLVSLGSVRELTQDEPSGSVVKVSDARLKTDVRPLGEGPSLAKRPYEPPAVERLGTLADLTAGVDEPSGSIVKPSDRRLKDDIRPLGDARPASERAYEPPRLAPLGSIRQLTQDEPVGSVVQDDFSDVRLKTDIWPLREGPSLAKQPYEPPAVERLGTLADLTAGTDEPSGSLVKPR